MPRGSNSNLKARRLRVRQGCKQVSDGARMLPTTKLDLFAGIPVSRYAKSRKWYERLLGSQPSFLPHGTEAVWELANHRFVYIVQQPRHAGHARLTIFVDDLDGVISAIEGRGCEPASRETYPNGVRKISFRDADGNEIGFGGAPKRQSGRRPKSGSGPRVSPR